jgi:peptidoglycan-N-acetylglucosamine deacetylase
MMASLLGSIKHTIADRLVPRSRLVRRGPTTRRRVALTFDDGPGELTPAFLDVLAKHRVPATFFLIGRFCAEHPELAREYHRRGHQVGLHGYDHRSFPALGLSELDDQLRSTAACLGNDARVGATGRAWVRPPHGALDARSLVQLLASDYVVAMWSLDSEDYVSGSDADDIAARCAPARVSPGEVILMHEDASATLEALPRIIRGLRGDGYELVTLADLVTT